MRTLVATLALASLVGPCPATAQTGRPFTVEDLVGHEDIGAVRISPDGRWISLERQAAYDQAASYRLSTMTNGLLTALEIRPAAGGAPTIRLAAPGHDAGYLSGPFSPDGTRMAVYRLTEDSFRLGVLTLATGALEWLPFTPELIQFGQTVAWRSPQELIFVARPTDDPPVTVRVGYKAQERIQSLWRAAAAGHRPSSVYIPSGKSRDERPRAEPSSLVAVDVVRRQTRVLARGEWFDLRLSPDGRHAALLEDAEDVQPDPDRPLRVGDPIRRRRLAIADLDTGQVRRPLQEEDFAMYLLSWSPDAARLLVFGRPPGGDFEADGRYWAIDAAGPARRLDLGDDAPWIERTWDGVAVPLASWNGARPVVQARTPGGARVWLSPEGGGDRRVRVVEPGERLLLVNGAAAIERSDGVYRFGGDGARLRSGRLIDHGQAADRGNPDRWNPDPLERGGRTLVEGACLSSLEDARPTCLTPLAPGERILAASPADDFLVTRLVTPQGDSAVRVRRAASEETIAVLNPDWRAIDWGRIVPVDHPGPRGRSLTSWLLLPPGPASGPPPPVVVEVYPGAAPRSAPAHLSPGTTRLQNNPVVLAGAGYAVLVISLPLDPGGPPAAAGLADRILAVVDEAGRRGLVDPARVALIGHSFGAYGVLSAATQSDRFRAVIASNGYADLSRSMELPPLFRAAPEEGVPVGQMAGWGETGQGSVGFFARSPEAYVQLSPLYQVDRLRTPTLLIESDLDTSRMGSLFSALYRLDREAALLTYYGEGHSYTSPGNLRDLHGRILDWLARYLGPPTRDPIAPLPGPGFEDRGQQGPVAGGAPDQALRGQLPLQLDPVQQPMLGEQALEEEGA